MFPDRRLLLASAVILSLPAIILAGCGGGAAPTSSSGSGGGSPVAVELPAISVPTSVATSVSDVSQYASSDIGILPALVKSVDDSFLASFVPSTAQDASRLQSILDDQLSNFSGMSCAGSAGNTTCQFTNSAGKTVKIDFGSFSLTDFSANNTNQSCNLDCVADTNTALSSNALCMRVWIDNARFAIGKWTVRPTSDDKGAGCMRFTGANFSGGTSSIGVIYDKSSTRASATSGANSYIETFMYSPPYSNNSHLFLSEAGTTSSNQLVTYNAYLKNTTNTYPSYVSARWPRDVDRWYGNVSQTSNDNNEHSEDGVCTKKNGTRLDRSYCSSTGSSNSSASDLTSPALSSFLGVAVDADHSLPSTSVFPESPTF